MVPSVGRIVHYRLCESDVAQIVARRNRHVTEVHWKNEHGEGIRVERSFDGNAPHAGDVYPMLITRVWSEKPTAADCVQGQVFLDGNDTLWKTSAQQQGHTYDPTTTDGVWFEPPRIG